MFKFAVDILDYQRWKDENSSENHPLKRFHDKIQENCDYSAELLLYPLLKLLTEENLREEHLTLVLHSFHRILTFVGKIELAFQIEILFCLQTKYQNISSFDVIKLEIMEKIFQKSAENIANSNPHLLAHSISTLLDYLTNEKNENLVKTKALDALINVIDVSPKHSVAFLPGVTSTIVKVCVFGRNIYINDKNKLKIGSKVCCKAILCLRKLLSNTMSDKNFEQKCVKIEKMDEKWLALTCGHLKKSFVALSELRLSKELNIRQGMYEFSREMIEKCSKTLGPCIIPLVEIFCLLSFEMNEGNYDKILDSFNIIEFDFLKEELAKLIDKKPSKEDSLLLLTAYVMILKDSCVENVRNFVEQDHLINLISVSYIQEVDDKHSTIVLNSPSSAILTFFKTLGKFDLGYMVSVLLSKYRKTKKNAYVLAIQEIFSYHLITENTKELAKSVLQEISSSLSNDPVVLKALSFFSHKLGSEIKDCFHFLLFPILQVIGTDSSANDAWVCLRSLALETESVQVSTLILNNVDYLGNDIYLRLRHFYRSRHCVSETDQINTAKMICAILSIVGNDALLHMDDSIDVIFDLLEKNSNSESLSHQYLNVLNQLSKISVESNMLPLTLRIFKVVRHYVTSDYSLIRMDSLKIISNCIPLMASDASIILSHLHIIWPFLLRRMTDVVHVSLEAFNVVDNAIAHCSEFLVRKVRLEILPKYISILESVYSDNIAEIESQVYVNSENYKVCKRILNSIMFMIQNKCICEEEYENISKKINPRFRQHEIIEKNVHEIQRIIKPGNIESVGH
jgi:hypothetical protein